MKFFVKKVLLFSASLLAYLGLNYGINSLFISMDTVDLQGASILLVGDSHMKYGLDPKLEKSTVNISHSAEPYSLSYWKCKKLLSENSVDLLVLSFSPHNISSFNDEKFSNPKWSKELFKRSYPIAEFAELEAQVSVNKLDWCKTLFKQMCFYPRRYHRSYLGSFVASKDSFRNNLEQVIRRHYPSQNKDSMVSITQISYLDSIVQLCRREKVRPVLVSTPLHKSYRAAIPAPIQKQYNMMKKRYKKDGFLIESPLTLDREMYLKDVDHLNALGSHQFSEFIFSELKN